jgi:hypothetical protein
MAYSEVFAPIEAHNRECVRQDTFGHLAPEKNRSYKGRILFIKSAFCSGSITIVNYDFVGLESSPWLYDAVYDELDKFDGLNEGSVYEWHTTFRNYRFYGKPFLKLSF